MQLPPVHPNAQLVQVASKPLVAKVYNKAEKYYNSVIVALTNVYSVYELASDLLTLPSRVHSAAKILGYTWLVDLVFAGPRIVTNITNLVEAKSFYGYANAMIMTASEVSNLATEGTQLIELLKDVKLLKRESCAWADSITKIFLPLQFIFLGQSIDQLVNLYDLRHNFRAEYKNPRKITTIAARLQNVKLGCQYVVRTADDLQYTLSLSKKCALVARSTYLLNRLEHADADQKALVEEGETFLNILQHRISTRCVLDVANAVVSCISTVLTCASLIAFATPVTTVLYAANTIAGIAISVFDSYISEKNPFIQPNESWANKKIRHFYHTVSREIVKIQTAVQTALHSLIHNPFAIPQLA